MRNTIEVWDASTWYWVALAGAEAALGPMLKIRAAPAGSRTAIRRPLIFMRRILSTCKFGEIDESTPPGGILFQINALVAPNGLIPVVGQKALDFTLQMFFVRGSGADMNALDGPV